MTLQEIRLPELGENIHTAQVIKILTSVGSSIKKEHSILELETEKSVFEIPSPLNGIVKTVHVKEGEKIKVHDLLLTVESKDQPIDTPEQSSKSIQSEKRDPVRKREENRLSSSDIPGNILTSPTVRKVAREMNIDLMKVKGSGLNGRILMEDLLDSANPASPKTSITPSFPDFSKWGAIERKPMTNVRLKTAEQVSKSWSLIPHVTQFEEVDITELENSRKNFLKQSEKIGGKLTITAILLKIIASALKKFPQLNSSIDPEKEEIILKKYIHIGIAVDTDRGLLAPVIRNVDQKTILELSVELKKISDKAKEKKLTPEEMQGGTFTLTNLGGIAGTYFTPIIHWPEVAILGIGRSDHKPKLINEKFESRLILPLSLSYDHRLVDGADAARFLKFITEKIRQPLSIESKE